MSAARPVSPFRRYRRILVWCAAVLAAVVVATVVPPAVGSVQHDRVVSEDPVDWTPHVLDGIAYTVEVTGDRGFVGGSFTEVNEPGALMTFTSSYLAAFNARTGHIDTNFLPDLDGPVHSLVVAPDGRSLYVGGEFPGGVARLDVDTGARWPGFQPASLDGDVYDIELAAGRLLVGGNFRRVGSAARPGLASLSAATGAADSYLDLKLAMPRNGGIRVVDLAVSPNGQRLVVLGTFNQVSGHGRGQIAVVDLTASPAKLAVWGTNRYLATCSTRFLSHVRAVDISADSKWFVVVTTGGSHAGTLCDTAARFEMYRTGGGITETWANYTGGDTLTSVAITGPAVYVGGHQRWLDNPKGNQAAASGAVSRPGLGAIHPTTGKALPWNAMRDRGRGVFDLHSTSAGLWMASDTEYVHNERHPRLAFFPL